MLVHIISMEINPCTSPLPPLMENSPLPTVPVIETVILHYFSIIS